MTLRKGHPWSRIDEVFREPPESTEQVLHPKKYLDRERPVAIVPGALPSLKAARELRRDVVGELEWKLLLSSKLSNGIAERAAEGWGGDRLVAYGQDEGPVHLVDLSAWDSEEDATQFEQAMRKWMARQTAQPERATEDLAVFLAGDEAWATERDRKSVV